MSPLRPRISLTACRAKSKKRSTGLRPSLSSRAFAPPRSHVQFALGHARRGEARREAEREVDVKPLEIGRVARSAQKRLEEKRAKAARLSEDAPIEVQSQHLLAHDDWNGLGRVPPQPSFALVDLYEPPEDVKPVRPEPTIKSEPPSPMPSTRPLFAPEHLFTPEPQAMPPPPASLPLSGSSSVFPFVSRQQRSVSTAGPASQVSEVLHFDAFTHSSPATVHAAPSPVPSAPNEEAIALDQLRSFDSTTWQRAHAERLGRTPPSIQPTKVELPFRLPLSPRSAAVSPYIFDVPSSPLPPVDQPLSVDWLLKRARPARAAPSFFVALADEE